MHMFETGTLWKRICQVTQQALRSGHLQPIATRIEYVPDGGVRFLVRIVENLARKRKAVRWPQPGGAGKPNPFLPYDPNLYVADASESHVCLLNKYNAVDHHLLIVTREFEQQDRPLTLGDFQALCRCMAEYDSLGFYNGGTIAGASQLHKHLQLVPLPLAPEGPRVPIEPLVDIGGKGVGRCDRIPFPHAVAALESEALADPQRAGRRMLEKYRSLLCAAGVVRAAGAAQPSGIDSSGNAAAAADGLGEDERPVPDMGPYNLLVTRQWMLVVPRTRESFESISLNSLAFAGALLVRNQQEMDKLKALGPIRLLRHVTEP